MLGNVYLTEKKLSSYAMFSSNTVQVKEQQSNRINRYRYRIMLIMRRLRVNIKQRVHSDSKETEKEKKRIDTTRFLRVFLVVSGFILFSHPPVSELSVSLHTLLVLTTWIKKNCEGT